MSGTVPPTPPPTPGAEDDKTTIVSRLSISLAAQLVFLAALAIAWWTKDPNLGLLLGVAATNATTVLAYWVGSSAGSAAKGKTLAALQVPPTATTTTTTAPSGASTTSTTGPVSRT